MSERILSIVQYYENRVILVLFFSPSFKTARTRRTGCIIKPRVVISHMHCMRDMHCSWKIGVS